MNRKLYITPSIEIISMQTEGVVAASGKTRTFRVDDGQTIRSSNKIFSRELDESSDFWVNEDSISAY